MRNTILQLADYGGPYPGNFIASLQALNKKLAYLGWKQVLVLSDIAGGRDWLQDLIRANQTVYLLPRNRPKLMLANEIGKIAKKENASIMHAHFSTFDMPAVGAKVMLYYRRKKIHVFRHVHSAFPVMPTFRRGLKDLMKFRFSGNLFHSIYVSPALHRSDISRGLITKKYDILPNGVDVTRFRNVIYGREELIERHGIQNSCDNLLMFGWDPITKGVDVALKACSKLADAGYRFNLIIVGEEKLNQYVGEVFNRELPSWLRIFTPEKDVAKLYRIADIFISASRYEGFSYAVCEAMASGLSIIASDIEGLDWAHKAPAVNFFVTEEVNDLTKKIECILKMDYSKRKIESEKNIQFVVDNHSVEKWAERLVSIYEKYL